MIIISKIKRGKVRMSIDKMSESRNIENKNVAKQYMRIVKEKILLSHRSLRLLF